MYTRKIVISTLVLILLAVVMLYVHSKAKQSVVTTEPGKMEIKDSLQERLTPLQYAVTQENATEVPYQNEYWDNHEEGIYVDIVSGQALFSSRDKYDSQTGWPSFVRPIDVEGLVYVTDSELGFERTEVRSKQADSHLGHVFDDGPVDRGGQRFCINSAAVRFVPRTALAEEGYSEYEVLFTEAE